MEKAQKISFYSAHIQGNHFLQVTHNCSQRDRRKLTPHFASIAFLSCTMPSLGANTTLSQGLLVFRLKYNTPKSGNPKTPG